MQRSTTRLLGRESHQQSRTPTTHWAMDHNTSPEGPPDGERWTNINMKEDLQAHRPPPPVPTISTQFTLPRPAPRPQHQLQRAPGHQLHNKSPAVNVVQLVPQPSTLEGRLQRLDPEHIPDHDGSNTAQAKARRVCRPQYRPFALRWPFLTALLLSLFILAGLLVVSLRILPIQHTDSLGNQMAKRTHADHQNRGRPTPFDMVDVENFTVALASHSMAPTSTKSVWATGKILPTSFTKHCDPEHEACGSVPPSTFLHLGPEVIEEVHRVHVRVDQRTAGSAVPAAVSTSHLSSGKTRTNSATLSPSSAALWEPNQVSDEIVFYSGFLKPGKHTIILYHGLTRRTEAAAAPAAATSAATQASLASSGATDVTATTLSLVANELSYGLWNNPGVKADLVLRGRTIAIHPDSAQRTNMPATERSTLSSKPGNIPETLVVEVLDGKKNVSSELGHGAFIPLGERVITVLEGLGKGTGLSARTPSSKIPQTTRVPVFIPSYLGPGLGPGAFLKPGREFAVIDHKLALRDDHTSVAAADRVRDPTLIKLAKRSVLLGPDASLTRPSEGSVTTVPNPSTSVSADMITGIVADEGDVNLSDCDKQVGSNAFLMLGNERWERAVYEDMSMRQTGAFAPPLSHPTAAGETAKMTTGLPTSTTALVVQSQKWEDTPVNCCANGVGPGAFMRPGKETIYIRAASMHTAAAPPSTRTPVTAYYPSDSAKLSGGDGGQEAGAHKEQFLELKETIAIRNAEGLGQGLDPSATTPPPSSVRQTPPTIVTHPLPLASIEKYSRSKTVPAAGMKPSGVLRVRKQAMAAIEDMAKRTEAVLPGAGAASHPDGIPLRIIAAVEAVVDGTKIATETSMNTAPDHLSTAQGLPAHYPFHNQSTATRLGSHETPVSVSVSISSSRPTHIPVSTVRPPLNTSQPVPEATTTEVTIKVYDLTIGTYFVCFFLPTLLCTLLQIPVRLVDQAVRLLQPFHAIAGPDGGVGRDSLWLETAGWRCRVASLRHIFSRRQSLVFLTGILQILTWLVTTFSATAVGLELVGSGCRQGDPYSVEHNCAMTPAVFLRPTIILLSLLGSMIIVLAIIMGRLAVWDTGVHEDPWSIAGTARLVLNKPLRSRMQLATPETTHERGALSTRFSLRHFDEGSKLRQGYGVVPLGSDQSLLASTSSLPSTVATFLTTSSTWINEKSKAMVKAKYSTRQKERLELPFTLGYTGRIVFLMFMCGLMIVILYYRNVSTPSEFEDFMDDESYGVTLLFTGIGTVATEFWSSFSEGRFLGPSPFPQVSSSCIHVGPTNKYPFADIALVSPYHCLATSSKAPDASLYLSRPTHALSGVRIALLRRHWFLLLVSLTSIAAEFLPIFLSNIPYNMTQLYVVYVDCYYVSIAILSLMVALVAASFFVRWTKLPADPLTLAGAMYHVIDSNILEELADRVEDDQYEDPAGQRKMVSSAPMLFTGVTVGYRPMVGMSGKIRTQVGITNLSA